MAALSEAPGRLPPAIGRLLTRPNFLRDVHEGGRCAREAGAGAEVDVSVEALLALLDTSASVAPSTGGVRRPPARGPDFELGRCVGVDGYEKFDGGARAASNASLAAAALAAGFSVTIRHAELRSPLVAAYAAAVGAGARRNRVRRHFNVCLGRGSEKLYERLPRADRGTGNVSVDVRRMVPREPPKETASFCGLCVAPRSATRSARPRSATST